MFKVNDMETKLYIKIKKQEPNTKSSGKTISVIIPMAMTHTVMELRGNKETIDAIIETLKEKFEVS
jgi:hypothetical protein